MDGFWNLVSYVGFWLLFDALLIFTVYVPACGIRECIIIIIYVLFALKVLYKRITQK